MLSACRLLSDGPVFVLVFVLAWVPIFPLLEKVKFHEVSPDTILCTWCSIHVNVLQESNLQNVRLLGDVIESTGAGAAPDGYNFGRSVKTRQAQGRSDHEVDRTRRPNHLPFCRHANKSFGSGPSRKYLT